MFGIRGGAQKKGMKREKALLHEKTWSSGDTELPAAPADHPAGRRRSRTDEIPTSKKTHHLLALNLSFTQEILVSRMVFIIIIIIKNRWM